MNQLIIGYGEIGKAVHAIVGESGIVDLVLEQDIPESVEVMHICMPYGEGFEDDVHAYIKLYNPQHIVVWSTVPIGTTETFGLRAVHSPVEGKHPELELSIRTMERWVGVMIKGEAQYFTNYFQSLGLSVKVVGSPKFTEALKLLSTTEYGINIEFARYKAMVANEIGMDFELTKEWNQEYNKLYKNLGLDKKFQKFVLDAPQGAKGGHCVVPNAELLNEQYPSNIVDIVREVA